MQVVDFSAARLSRAAAGIARRAGVSDDDVLDYMADELLRRLERGEHATPGLMVGVARHGAAWGRLRPRHEVPWPTDADGEWIDLAAPESEEYLPDLPDHIEELARHVRSGGTAAVAVALGLSQRRIQQVMAAGDRATLERWGWLLLQQEQQGDLWGRCHER